MWDLMVWGIPVKRLAAYASVLTAGVFSPVRLGVVVGDSMSPSMKNGQPYLMQRTSHLKGGVKRGDVVVFQRGGNANIKRVMAAAGETVTVIRYANGDPDELVVETMRVNLYSAIQRPTWQRSMKMMEITVPEGHVYVVGDNLDSSMDSRVYGAIPLESIRGKMLFAPEPAGDWTRMAIHGPPSGT